MNELISKIYDHKKNDPKIVYNLMNFIDTMKYKSVMELEKYENEKFTYEEDERKLTDEEIAQMLFEAFTSDVTHFDYIEVEDESKLEVLHKQYLQETDLDNKFIILIKIYAILGWGIPVPFRAYSYILDDRLG